jgi:4-hydroxy-3-methylbut-2-enyl diphosphate reductase
MIDGPQDIRQEWLVNVKRVGLTAGASAPELLVRQVIDRLREFGATQVLEMDGKSEHVMFPVPKELRAS